MSYWPGEFYYIETFGPEYQHEKDAGDCCAKEASGNCTLTIMAIEESRGFFCRLLPGTITLLNVVLQGSDL
jgi:hypothetical protein